MTTAAYLALVAPLTACSHPGKTSATFAKDHAHALVAIANEDIRQVRTGLPLGAAELSKILPPPGEEITASAAREALEKARNKVQDLRVAKSTFFALVDRSGVVIRNDQPQDRMVGKNLLDAFAGLRAAMFMGGYVETVGSMPEASEVRGKPDAEFTAAAAVKAGDETRALYVTGWSWSAYAYRLENAVRSAARSAANATQKEPLLYAFVIVDDVVYGAPISPEVNAKAVHDNAPLAKLRVGVPFSAELEITGRAFGLAAELVPEFPAKVAVAVLRSET